MFDFVIKYGNNHEFELRGGYSYMTAEMALLGSKRFLDSVPNRDSHYKNAVIDYVKI